MKFKEFQERTQEVIDFNITSRKRIKIFHETAAKRIAQTDLTRDEQVFIGEIVLEALEIAGDVSLFFTEHWQEMHEVVLKALEDFYK